MEYFKKILKESVPSIVTVTFISLFAGGLLSASEEALEMFPIILLVLPALNSMLGDIITVFVSRVSSHFFIGSMPVEFKLNDRGKTDIKGLMGTFLICVVSIFVMGYGLGYLTDLPIQNPILVSLSIFMASLILIVLFFVIFFIFSVYFFKKGNDPNNVLLPFITIMGDALVPLMILLFISVFLL